MQVFPHNVLLIDDLKEQVVKPLGMKFRKVPTFTAAECHSVEQALAAIEQADPQVILLDHELTDDRHAGIKIAEEVWRKNKNIRIVSTSTKWHDEQSEYNKLALKMGAKPVMYVDKHDFAGIEAIIYS